MNLGNTFAVALAATVITCFGTVPGSATLINFDNLAAGTLVTTQYASDGVVFSDAAGPDIADLGSNYGLTGYSPPNVLFVNQHQSDDSGDLRLDFSVSITSVTFLGFLSDDYYLTAIAYGAGGTLLGTTNFSPAPAYGVATPYTISETSPISYLLLTTHPAFEPSFFGNFSIDNLSFAGATVPEASTWAMMLIGFAGLGFAGYRQRRKLAGAAGA
jgi:hypothetical protein